MFSIDTRQHAWIMGAAAGAGLAIIAISTTLLPSYSALVASSFLTLGLGIWGLRTHKPKDSFPWIAYLVGVSIFGISNLFRLIGYQLHTDLQVVVDSLENLAYVAVLIATLGLSRRRNVERDPSVVIDALIITVGVAAIVWLAVLLPHMQDDSVSMVKRGLDTLSGTMSIALVFAIARYGILATRRLTPVSVLCCGAAFAIASEAAESHTAFWHVPTAHATAVLALSTVGLAIAHPQVKEVSQTLIVGLTTSSRKRFVGLGLAAIASPVFLIVQLLSGSGSSASYVGLSVTGLVASVLVLLRIFGMMRAREADARLDVTLRQSVKRLVGATNPHDVEIAAVESVRCLLSAVDEDVDLLVSDSRLEEVFGSPTNEPSYLRSEPVPWTTQFPLDEGNSDRHVIIRSSRPIPLAVVEALESLVVDVSLASQRSQALAARASIEERRRIERDLHDDVQQRLLGLRLRLSLLKARVDDDTGSVVDNYSAELGSTVRAIRRIVHGEGPSELKDGGLVQAIRRMTQSLPSINVQLDLPEHDPDGLDIESAYFVFCEALTNVLKHSNAKELKVGLWSENDIITLQLTDDGIGFDHESPGFGLQGMQTRLANIGGRLNVLSLDGNTVVSAHFVCPASAIKGTDL